MHTIKLAVDTCEAEQFCKWLNSQGHKASIGNTTTTEIDGALTFNDEAAREISAALWSAYCNS